MLEKYQTEISNLLGKQVKLYYVEVDQDFSKQIIDIITNITGLDINLRTREREYATARFIAFYFIRHKARYEFKHIARLFKMNHSTVIYGINQVDNLRKIDKYFNSWFIKCEDIISKLQ